MSLSKQDFLTLPNFKCKTAICVAFGCLTSSLQATEGGGSNYLPGFYGDLSMAVFPESGTYFNNFLAAYQDVDGNTGTLLEMPGVMHVTEQTVLGGQFALGFYPGLMATADRTGPNNLARVGLADFYLVPGGIVWQKGNFHAFLFEGIVMPTGRYEANQFNTGRNYWTFDHNFQLTWNLPFNSELSFDIGYMNNLENTATDYRSGDEFHFDYTVGHYPLSNLGIGITGSYYKQVTRDEAPKELITTEMGEGSSIGPVLMYTPKIGGRDVSFSVKWLREFDVTGRPEQEYVVFRILAAF